MATIVERQIRRWPRLYRFLRAVVSPLLPGRDGRKLLQRLGPKALVLNVGSGPLVYGPGIINVDPERVYGVRVQGEAEALPFATASVDGVICEVTLEHVRDPDGAVSEMARVLRPGGLLYLSVPFLQPFHSEPRDFVRWTLPGLRRLVGDLHVLESGVAGGPTAALTWFLAEYIGLLLCFGSRTVQDAVSLTLRVLFAPLKVLDLLLVRLAPSEIVASLIYVVVEKGGAIRAS